MPQIRFAGQVHPVEEGETVLDALLRAGHSIPNSCRAGACQSCLLKATSGEIPAPSQNGLKPALREQSCFLSCICRPTGDLELSLPTESARYPATIEAITPLSPTVFQILLTTKEAFSYRAGQYLTLFRDDPQGQIARSYSIASLPDSAHIELHVRLIPNGAMSAWLATQARPGDAVAIQGPAGNCFYTEMPATQPLILAGTGTGLAPLYGVLRDALRQNHSGPITLLHGALNDQGIYLREELSALAAQHRNVNYHPVVLDRDGPLPDYIAQRHNALKGYRAFVCGDPAIVNTLSKRFFLAGVSSRDIHSDSFLPTPSR
jgi:ferredoxin-NADP reductase